MPARVPTPDALQTWLISWLASRLELDPQAVGRGETFSRLGLDSTRAVALAADLAGELGRPLSPLLVWEHPTIDALVAHLTATTGPAPPPPAAERPSSEPIAIVGMACRFPGAPSPRAFWRLLCEGRDAITEVPAERWDVDAWYHPDRDHPETINTRCGGFLEGIDRFDPLFFHISPREAVQMDPQQRLMLELTWEALEDAGLPPDQLAGTPTGVFFGAMWQDYADRHRALHAPTTQHTGAGQALNVIANRVSYVFGLEGPSLVVDTACSSSLVAADLACRSLHGGESEVALAGGVNLILSPATMVRLSKFGGLSGDGRCKTFDHRADGFGRGEGAGVVVLKPLSRALADGDRIYCVIRAGAVNNDGFSNGLTAPNPRAQEAVLRTAYARAGVAPGEVHYVELHGTGTEVGDPIEAQALAAALGRERPADQPLLVGTVKTNLGHLEPAAGIAGLIKTALAVHHRQIPPSLHFERPNPMIPLEEMGLRVQCTLAPWPAEPPARAGVSAFGWGGTNCHLVIEEVPADRTCLLPLAAPSTAVLDERAGCVLELLRSEALPLPGLCRAAVRQLAAGSHRLAVTGRSRDELREGLEAFLQRRPRPGLAQGPLIPEGAEPRPGLVFVCSPVGAQWCGMGRDLLADEPVVRATLERCDRVWRELAGWSLRREMARAEEGPGWQDGGFVFPLLFAFEVATAALWRSWGIVPDAVVGHSLGEITAGHLAGALTLEDALRLVFMYGRLLSRLADQAGLAVVGLPADPLQQRLAEESDRLWVAGCNGPSSTLVAGELEALDRLLASLEPREIFRARVPIRLTAHCPYVEPLLDELREGLRGLRPQPPWIPLISALTGRAVTGRELDADYWVRHLREPIRFAAAVEELVRQGHRTFLQLDPHPLLARSLDESFQTLGVAATALASARRKEPARPVLLDSLGVLYARGHAVRWQRLAPPGTTACDLPAALVAGEEEATEPQPEPEKSSPVLIPLSAHTPEALEELVWAVAAQLRETPAEDAPGLDDLAYTAALRRGHHEHRLALVVDSVEQVVRDLESWLAGQVVPTLASGRVPRGQAPRVAFVFSGQGPQWWWAMGRELLAREPAFRATLERCDEELRRHVDWSLRAEITTKPSASRMQRPAIAQPILFALQAALVAVWRSWGIVPEAVVGHSFGEVAAAWTAGVLSLGDAVRVAVHRGRVMEATLGRGTMATVELPAAEAEEICRPYGERLVVASVNAPATVVVAGEIAAVEEVVEELSGRGIGCWPLRAKLPFHSPLMEEAGRELEAALDGLEPHEGHCPIVSAVTGEVAPGRSFDASYWRRNVRQPVRFAAAIDVLAVMGCDVFLEICTQPLLSTAVSQCLEHRGADATVRPSMRAGREYGTLLEALGGLYTRGCPVAWDRLHPLGGRLVPLPAYPFQRRRYCLPAADEAPRPGAAGPAPVLAAAAQGPAGERMAAVFASQLRAFNQLVEQQLEVLDAEIADSTPDQAD